MAETLNWSLDDFDKALAEIMSQGLAEADLDARVIWIPNGIKYNPPASPNVVTSWRYAWEAIPECGLKRKAYTRLKAFTEGLGDAFGNAFTKACPKPSTNQEHEHEHEQEQEQEQEQEETSRAEPSKSNGSAQPSPKVITLTLKDQSEHPITQVEIDGWQTLYPGVDVMQELRKMRGWCEENERKRKTRSGIPRFVTGWLQKSQNRLTPKQTETPADTPTTERRYEWNEPPDLDRDEGKAKWTEALSKLSGPVDKHSFSVWLAPTEGLGIKDGVLYVRVPDPDHVYIGDKYDSLLREVLPDVEVRFIAPTEVPHA